MKKILIVTVSFFVLSCNSNKNCTYDLINDFTEQSFQNIENTFLKKSNTIQDTILILQLTKKSSNYKNLSNITTENIDVWWKNKKYSTEFTSKKILYLKSQYINAPDSFLLEKNRIFTGKVLKENEIMERARNNKRDYLILKISQPIFNKPKDFAVFNCSYYLTAIKDENRIKESIIIMGRSSKHKWSQVGELYINVTM